jgi:hypothetical protein
VIAIEAAKFVPALRSFEVLSELHALIISGQSRITRSRFINVSFSFVPMHKYKKNKKDFNL